MIRKFEFRGELQEAQVEFVEDLGRGYNNEHIPGILATIKNFDSPFLKVDKKPCTLLLSLTIGKKDENKRYEIEPYYEFAISYDLDEDDDEYNDEYYVFYSSNPASCEKYFSPEILKLFDYEIEKIKYMLDIWLNEHYGKRLLDFRGKTYAVRVDYIEDRAEDDYGNSLDGLSITLGENRVGNFVDCEGKPCKVIFDLIEGSPIEDEDDELSQLPQYQFCLSYNFDDKEDDDEENGDVEMFYDSSGEEKYVSYGLFEISEYEIEYIKTILCKWFEEYKEM